MPRQLPLIAFGDYLKQNRKRTGLSQVEIAQRLGTSQSMVAQLETGRISNPSQKTLRLMAEVYDVDFDLLVWEFASEKYDLQESPWFISAPKRFPTFAGVSGLPVICKAFRTSGVLPMLDLDGILQWQLQFPNLQRLWFWSLRFGNRAYDAAVNATQKELLKRGIKITFFIDGEDATSGGDFWMWQNAMSHDAEVGELFRKQVAVIPAPREAVIWNSGEAILANGHDFTLKPNGILVVSGECGLELGQEKLTASMRMMMTCANDQDKVGSMFV